jgi:small subunit ribosomal protein S17
MSEPTAPSSTDRNDRKTRVGIVVSAKMAKTIVVRVDHLVQHGKYERVIKRSSKFHAHDERGEAKLNDVVRIAETRPLSRMKRWRLLQVIRRAEAETPAGVSQG